MCRPVLFGGCRKEFLGVPQAAVLFRVISRVGAASLNAQFQNNARCGTAILQRAGRLQASVPMTNTDSRSPGLAPGFHIISHAPPWSATNVVRNRQEYH